MKWQLKLLQQASKAKADEAFRDEHELLCSLFYAFYAPGEASVGDRWISHGVFGRGIS